jgi:hypothetical protein
LSLTNRALLPKFAFALTPCVSAQPLDSWLASSDQDSFLTLWVRPAPVDDGQAPSGEDPELWEGLEDPVAKMLKAREKALLAALRYSRSKVIIATSCSLFAQCLGNRLKYLNSDNKRATEEDNSQLSNSVGKL